MTRQKLVTYAIAAAFLGAFFMFARTPATSADAPYEGKPEIVAATFASSWCSACKVLKPKLAKVIPGFKDKPVAFVEFDFTFGPRDEIRAEADKYGIGDLYERNKGATGFTVLVDSDTGAILDTLTMNFSEDAMRAAIAQAIAIASHTDDTAPLAQ
ncbi:MAG: thioredoxin domain-containing protein [Pseudomonadota bacterium]